MEARNEIGEQFGDDRVRDWLPTAAGIEQGEMLAGLLDGLRPRQRQILQLRFFDELSQTQIAEQIGTSQVHIGRLIASSLAELRSHLREDPPRPV